jgi:hypothetical protein
LGKLDNASAVARVQQLFQVWQDVKTASITFQRDGNIAATGAYTGGAVDTAAKFNAVDGSCTNNVQSPVVFDANGSLFTDLGLDEDVIGFAGPCAVDPNTGRITASEAVLNGKWIDNNAANGELNDRQFDETFVHEFGHFIGLDHSQISLNVLNQPVDHCNRSDLEVLPVMFPFAHCQARLDETLPPLAPDDEAWISMFYPETVTDPGPTPTRIRFDSVYGIMTGKVFFGDGVTPAQGFNVLARDNNATRNRTFSVVSGYLFTASMGQNVAVNNQLGSPFGSRDLAIIGSYSIPVLPGTFNVSVEAIFPDFIGGSSVGPLFPIRLPGFSPPPPVTVTVTAGPTPAAVNDVVLTDQLSRFDQFEGR